MWAWPALVAAALLAYVTGRWSTAAGLDAGLLITLIGGYPIFSRAWMELLHGRLSADLAVSLAALGALYIGQPTAAAEVMLIMLIGEALEAETVSRTRAAIAALLRLRPRTAHVLRPEGEVTVPIEELRRGDRVVVRPGEYVPADGRVRSGFSSVDERAMTGESLPADKGPGDIVLAGTTNLHGRLEIEVERVGEDTALARIFQLVNEAANTRARIQRRADAWARWFVPIVLVLGAATGLWTRDLVRAISVLVVACPCALVLATPTAIVSGIGALVRRGVLVKGGVALETLAQVRIVLFDKTGTLTLAQPRVGRIVPVVPSASQRDVLWAAATVEAGSEHPLARVILQEAQRTGWSGDTEVHGFLAHPGLGAQAMVEGRRRCVGRPQWVSPETGDANSPAARALEELLRGGGTVVGVAEDGRLLGWIEILDAPRPEAAEALHELAHLGVQCAMLTGDHPAAARAMARALGLADYRAQLLPAEKVEEVRRRSATSGPVAMVGDGLNDAPALTAADVGIAMADVGSDLTVESADVVLVGGDLRKLPIAIRMARRVHRTIRQNILGFAIMFNGGAVIAAATGWLTPVWAAVVHQIGSLAVVLNSMRLLWDWESWRDHWAGLSSTVHSHQRAIVSGAAVVAMVAWLASGFTIIRPNEIGIVRLFGRPVLRPWQPGLHWRLPWPLSRLDRCRPEEVRRVEIGFRSTGDLTQEPYAYEWNIQHRAGRYRLVPEEATVWSGDENLVDVNLTVHYRLRDPFAALFRLGSGEWEGEPRWDAIVRRWAESTLRLELAARPADDVLAEARTELEQRILERLRGSWLANDGAFEVLDVRLADVHPPLEVVGAFREVAEAVEVREATINEAQAYNFATRTLARGQAAAMVVGASAWATGRVVLAQAAAERFLGVADARAPAPEVTDVRLVWAAREASLRNRPKVVVATSPGTRRWIWLDAELGRTVRGLWPAPSVGLPAQEELKP